MAVTLQRRGYVQVDENDRYTLTLKMFELAHRQQPLKSLVSVALPLLRELASRARQSCHLAVYQGGRVVVIAQVESPERWSFGLKVGVSMGLTDTSSGHVLLAFRDEVERTRMLAAHIKVEGELESDPGELFAILAEVRQRGCASMPSRQIRGITNVAYRDGRGRPCDRGHQRAAHRAHRPEGQPRHRPGRTDRRQRGQAAVGAYGVQRVSAEDG